MPILAIASKKGGVGKTTLALNLGLALARRGWRTLVADADPLGCVGLSVDRLNGSGGGLLAFPADGEEPAGAIRETRVSTLQLLPAGAVPETGAGEGAEEAAAGRLGEALRSLEADRDLVVVDTASGLGALGRAAVAAADRVLVPIQAEPLALRTTHPVLETLGDLRSRGSSVGLAGFVLSMVDTRDEVCLQVAQEAWSTLPSDLVLEAFVPRDPAFLRASAAGVPVGLLSKRPPPAAAVFDQIAAELEPRLGLTLEDRKDDAPIPLLD